jgi:hypothetical protein
MLCCSDCIYIVICYANYIENIKKASMNDRKMRHAAIKESKQLEKLVAEQRDMIQYLQKQQSQMLSSVKAYEPYNKSNRNDAGIHHIMLIAISYLCSKCICVNC